MIFNRYARYYDVFYFKKDYKKECAFLNEIFREYRSFKPKTILDLGCGTGGHAVLLGQKGYHVTGVDASAAMLKIAQEKNLQHRLKIKFVRGRLGNFNLKGKFDTIICMFSVIDYLTKKSELTAMLKNVHRHMNDNALFIFDFWNEEAVVPHYTARKKKVFTKGKNLIERRSLTRIFPSQKLCEVNYRCRVGENGLPVSRFQEKHTVRYFGVDEMASYLNKAGFTVLASCPFLHLRGAIRKNTWDVTMVAEKSRASKR